MADTVALPDLVGRVRLDTGGLDKSLSGIRNAIAGAFVLTEVKNFVSGGVSALANLERLSAQTGAAIKSTGNAANVSVDHITGLSKSIEDATSIEKENVQAGANMLLTFTNIKNVAGEGNDIFDQSVHTLTDFSTAMGEDTTSAAIRLGKALQDPILGVTALRRVGVQFTAEQKDQIQTLVESGNALGAQKIILAEVNKEFGGSADALGNTLQGRINHVHDRFRELGETVAKTVLPAIEGVIRIISPVIEVFGKLDPGIQTAIVTFVGFSSVALALIPIIRAVQATVEGLELSLGPLGIVLAAASIAIGVFASNQDHGTKAAKNWADALREDNGVLAEHSNKLLADSFAQHDQLDNLRAAGVTTKEVAKALDASTSSTHKRAEANGVLRTELVSQAQAERDIIHWLGGSKNAYDQLLVTLAKKHQLDDGLIENLEKQKKALAEGRISQADYNKVVGDAAGATDALGNAADSTGAAVDAMGNPLLSAAQKAQTLADAITTSFSSQRNYDSALRGIERANLAVAAASGTDLKSTQSLSAARDKASEAAQRLKSAQEAIASAQDRVSQAQDGIVQADRRRADAEASVQDAIVQTAQAEADLGEKSADVATAQSKLTSILQGYGSASKEAADATEALNKALRDQESSQLDVADAQDALSQARINANKAGGDFGANSAESLKAQRDLERAQIALANAQDKLRDDSTKATTAQQDLNDAVSGAAPTSDKAQAAVADLTSAQKAQKSASEAVTSAHKAEIAAQQNVTDATKGQTDAAKALNKAQLDVKDATQGLADVQAKNATAAMDGYGASAKSAAEKALDLKDALDQQQAAYDDAAAAAGDKALQEANANAQLNGQTLPAAEQLRIKLQAQYDEYASLRDSLAPGSPLRANIQGHIDELAKVPGIVPTDVTVNLGEFHQGIKNLFAGIAGSFGNFFNPLAKLLPGAPQVDVGKAIDAIKRLVPVFHEGGVMPGAAGSQGLALLRAGEVVVPQGAVLAGATNVYIDMTVHGVTGPQDFIPQMIAAIKTGVGSR